MRALRIGVAALLLAGSIRASDTKGSADILNRGQQVSTAIATVTSTAISPLLGVCLLGIYDYARASPQARAALPFYSKPHFWIPIGILLILIFFKDSIGGTFHVLKKPLDAVEVLVVNKAALVLIAFPVMYHEVSQLTGIRDIAELIQPVVYAAAPDMLQTAGHIASASIMLIAGAIITIVVWVVGHALDVVALLSPIPFLDLAVKGARALVLIAVGLCAVLNPTLGLIASLIVIGISALFFFFALRVLILGTVFACDVLFGGKQTPRETVRAFTVGKIHGMPRQTLGTLARDPNGILEFRYRRVIFGPTRRIRLENASAYDLGRGILYPSVVLPKGERHSMQFRLLPRYRGSEETIRATLGLASIRDLGLGKLVPRKKEMTA